MKANSEENEQFSILSRLVLLPPGIGSASTCIAMQSQAKLNITIQIHLHFKAMQIIRKQYKFTFIAKPYKVLQYKTTQCSANIMQV